MKVISILNPKGGAGKTVSSVNIAYALIRKGKKVLLYLFSPIGLSYVTSPPFHILVSHYYFQQKLYKKNNHLS